MNAKESAALEEKRQTQTEREASRTKNERMEKARLRGMHALEKEVLAENYQEILGELSALQKADREKRQRELGNIPVHYILLYKVTKIVIYLLTSYKSSTYEPNKITKFNFSSESRIWKLVCIQK